MSHECSARIERYRWQRAASTASASGGMDGIRDRERGWIFAGLEAMMRVRPRLHPDVAGIVPLRLSREKIYPGNSILDR